MINKPPPFEGLNTGIPIIIPIRGRGFINQGSGLTLNPKTLNPSGLVAWAPQHPLKSNLFFCLWLQMGLGANFLNGPCY